MDIEPPNILFEERANFLGSKLLLFLLRKWVTKLKMLMTYVPFGWMGSGHSWQVILTRDSLISTLRYCFRHCKHARWPHLPTSKNSSGPSSAKHNGHSMDAGKASALWKKKIISIDILASLNFDTSTWECLLQNILFNWRVVRPFK